MFKELDTLLARKNQRFVCYAAGGTAKSGPRFTAHIEHEVAPPLDEAGIASLRKQVGDLPEVIAFYQRYGGLRLYCDKIKNTHAYHAAAYCIAPPADWFEYANDFLPWIDMLDEEDAEDVLPDWISDYVVIGEIPNSANYILMPLAGPERGTIVEFYHDGCEFVKRSAGLEDYIAMIGNPTPTLLHRIDARYADGKTDKQWICEEYHYDHA
jgi:hypothetical protein